jgi:hypothetical protein
MPLHVFGPNAMESANAGLWVFSAVAKRFDKWDENHALEESFNKTAEELAISAAAPTPE